MDVRLERIDESGFQARIKPSSREKKDGKAKMSRRGGRKSSSGQSGESEPKRKGEGQSRCWLVSGRMGWKKGADQIQQTPAGKSDFQNALVMGSRIDYGETKVQGAVDKNISLAPNE